LDALQARGWQTLRWNYLRVDLISFRKLMSKAAKKRLRIFNAYVGQLKILHKNGQLDSRYTIDKYICPLCLDAFSLDDLDQTLPNPLTLEDAPPKSLGGKANTLTCKSCNNTMGKEIDSHLTLRLNELDKKSFLPNTSSKVKILKDDVVVQGTIEVDEKGEMKVFHSKKNNHPQKLEDFSQIY
jgi:hypothetical protein